MHRFRLPKSLLVLIATLAVIGPAATAAPATAEIFTVDTLDDVENGSCAGECTLRDAIRAANELEGPDEIVFSVKGTIKLEEVGEGTVVFPLPPITDELVIDGSTAPGWDGTPVVEIDGEGAESDGGAVGLLAREAPATIYALAINGFDRAAIEAGFEGSVLVAENFLGTNLAGTAPKPNRYGVVIGEDADVLNLIGGECSFGNVISGNDEYGILDRGVETRIRGNRIGTTASGSGPLPNGAGGIDVELPAFKPLISAIECEEEPSSGRVGNTIAFNGGPGIVIGDVETFPTIYGNSIHSNDGLGIQFLTGEPIQPPTLLSAKVEDGSLTITGEVPGFGGDYIVDLYANEECDPTGTGEGQTYLGEVSSDSEGAPFEATFPYPAGMPVITGTTSVGGELSYTGPFSECLEADLPPAPPAPPSGGPSPPAPSVGKPVPVNRRSVLLEPVSGTILVKVPGSGKFQNLTELTSIPIGSIVDARKGKVRLTSVNSKGVEQSALFYGGMFKIASQDRSGLVTLNLFGGNFSSCKKGAGGSYARLSKKPSRHLWGSGSGRFKTKGNFGAASVRGTIWLTKDECKGTFFKVKRGVVSVSDFVLDKTLKLPAGKTYWAKRNP